MGHMDNLVQFLRDRLDEDEQAARGTETPPDWHQGPVDDPEWESDEVVHMWPPEHHTPYEQDKYWRGLTADTVGLAAHIARHDPARVLREIEAKREIVRQADLYLCDSGPGCGYRTKHGHSVLRLLALPYADHPDYKETWKP